MGLMKREDDKPPPPSAAAPPDMYPSTTKAHDMTHPLSAYYISSSHNTYLHGHQLVGQGGTEMIARALRKGCRVVELDVYNATNASAGGPVVRHGETFTSAVPFADCIAAVRDHAFATSTAPVIITLENHCDEANQIKMAEILQDLLTDDMMYVPPDVPSQDTMHQSPASLKGRVLLRAKVLGAQGEVAPALRRLVGMPNAKWAAVYESGTDFECTDVCIRLVGYDKGFS